MTDSDIIRLAEQVGINYRKNTEEFYSDFCDGICIEDLKKFVAGIKAIEREACAEVCDAYGMPDGTSETARVLAVCIRARTLHELNKAAQQNGEEL